MTRRIAIAFGCQIALSSIHHIYGGFVYQSAFRLFMPFIAVGEWLVVMGLLSWYRRTRRSIALTLFSTAAALVGIVQGLVHVVYGHAYKNILFAAGIPRDSVTTFFRPLTPNDFVYPPNDIFFEGTGLLQLVTIALIARFTYCLLRKEWRVRQRVRRAVLESRRQGRALTGSTRGQFSRIKRTQRS